MQIRSDNFRININLVDNLIEDIKLTKKQDFNELFQNRIDKCNKLYVSNFEDYLDKLIDLLENTEDIDTAEYALKNLSKLNNSLIKAELKLFEVLSKE